MHINRRHLFQTSIGALIGFQLTRLGITPVTAAESPRSDSPKTALKQGRIGLIPPQLSQQFFNEIIATDRSTKDRYDSLVAQGFKFSTDALVGTNVSAGGGEWLLAMLTGKRAIESTGMIEYAVISTIYTNKTLVDIGASRTSYDPKTAQFQTMTVYLPETEKTLELQLDRQLLVSGTPAALAAKIAEAIERTSGKDAVKSPQKAGNIGSSLSNPISISAIESLRRQLGREDFLTASQDKGLVRKLKLATRNMAVNRSKEKSGAPGTPTQTTLVTLPLVIELALVANLIGNAKKLEADPVIMPRHSEIPEPSYR
jgi:hypothetical protein